jgi:exodeoxyribonuclease V alpha subunit
MKVTGTITRVTYHNKTNGYTVALLLLNHDEYSIMRKKSKLIGNQLTVVGCFDRLVLPEEEYTLDGDFVKNDTYGLQFKFESFSRKSVYTEAGVISYLSSDIFEGVGLKTAKKIVEKLGVEAIDKIYNDCSVLEGLGIKQKTIDHIYQVIIDNKASEEIILFFFKNSFIMKKEIPFAIFFYVIMEYKCKRFFSIKYNTKT